jgi:spore germination protein GerM
LLKRIIWVLLLVLGALVIWQVFVPPVKPDQPTLPTQPVKQTLTIYVLRKTNAAGEVTDEVPAQLTPLTRSIPLPPDSVKRLTLTVEALIAGPTEAEKAAGYYSELPPPTTVLGVASTANGLVLNLSADFTSGGGTDSMGQRLNQLIATVEAAVPNTPVFLDVNGQRVTFIGGEGIEVPQPLKRPVNPG